MALPEPSPKDGLKSRTPADQEDKDFDPSPEALIDEFDDERTLEEEEALDGNNGKAVQEELDDLKKESEMPIEELLAYYERMRQEAQGDDSEGEEEDDGDDEEEDEDEDEDEDEEMNEKEVVKNGGKNEKDEPGPDGSGADKGKPSSSDNSPHPAKSAESEQNQQNFESKQTHKQGHNPNQGVTDSAPQPQTNPSEQSSNSDQTPQKGLETPTSSKDQISSEVVDIANMTASPSQRPRHPMTSFVADGEHVDMFDSLFGYSLDDSDEIDEDYSYTDDENSDDDRDWRRVIHVGPDYQANVPEGLSEYDFLPPYENQDTLVWKCNSDLTQEKIVDYLKQASSLNKKNDISSSPASVPKIPHDRMRLYQEKMLELTSSSGSNNQECNHDNPPVEALSDVYMSQSRKRARIDYELEQENALDGANQVCVAEPNQSLSSREDNSDTVSQEVKPDLSTEEYFQSEEELLYLLLQCNHNIGEAIRRRQLNPSKYYLHEPMSLWSQDECLGFEHGLRLYGKNFRSIRENRVPTRTYAEVVAFYYIWKKSERHDVYTNQYKLDKKRCLSHPGTTDYMDKFIEDESNINATSSSPTPTPTESTVGQNSTAETSSLISLSLPFQPSDDGPISIQYIDLPPESTAKIHLQLHPAPPTETCLKDK